MPKTNYPEIRYIVTMHNADPLVIDNVDFDKQKVSSDEKKTNLKIDSEPDFENKSCVFDVKKQDSDKSIGSDGHETMPLHSKKFETDSFQSKSSSAAQTSDEEQDIGKYDNIWKKFNFKRKDSKIMKINPEKIQQHKEKHQKADLNDFYEGNKELFFNFKSQLCQSLSTQADYHKVFNMSENKVITWRTKSANKKNLLPQKNSPQVVLKNPTPFYNLMLEVYSKGSESNFGMKEANQKQGQDLFQPAKDHDKDIQ